MYSNILAAVNEYTNSEAAARYAIALARSCRARLFLLFVAGEGIGHDVFRRAEAALERLFIEAEGEGIEVRSVTETGDPFSVIRATVQNSAIDIVFTATRREDVKKRFFTKTLARDLMLRLPCSVAMVRVVHMGKVHPRRILVPLRSRMSRIEERSCFVARLASSFGSTVTLFHLSSPLTSFFQGEVHLSPAEREQRLSRDVEEFAECLRKYEVLHEKKTGYGAVPRTITIEAAHRRSDLIIMGASERGLLEGVIRRSPIEQVLMETPCNLIILNPRQGTR